MSRDPPTRKLRLIEAEAARQGRFGRCKGGNFPGIAAILSCNARRNPMFDTLTPRSTTGDFETMPCARPDPGGFLTEARTGTREAAGHMKDLAERFAELRNAIIRLPGNPSCDDRAGLRDSRPASTESNDTLFNPGSTSEADDDRQAARSCRYWEHRTLRPPGAGHGEGLGGQGRRQHRGRHHGAER